MYKNIQFKIKRKFILIAALTFGFQSAGVYHAKAESNYTTVTLTQQDIKTKKVTIDLKDKAINTILAEIQRQTHIEYGFSSTLKPTEMGLFSISVKDKSVEETLNILLSDSKYKYSIVANKIIIEPKNKQQSNSKITVKGKVLNEEKQPLIGAMVLLKGTTIGGITDHNGEYAISFMPDDGSVLSVTFVGYQDKDIPYTGGSTINIEMKIDAMAVEDVVVTGIFNKAKESYTGSVTTITAKDLKMYKGQNILNTLKNFDPSLNVVSSNEFGSDPNRLPEVNIRGNSSLPMSVKDLNENAKAQLNTPLVIIDGFEVGLQKLIDYNDEEIESINIMKDASATAIYGSRGANGVIVVTTKAPVEGKLKLFVQGAVNIEMPDLTSYDILNAKEKFALEQQLGYFTGANISDDLRYKARYAKIMKDVLAGVNTDWMAQPVQTGVGQKYNLRLEGGSDEFRWSTSVSYNEVKGAMKGSDKKTFSGTVSLSYTFKNFIFKNQTTISTNKGKDSNYGSFDIYAKQNPYYRIYDDGGSLIKTYERSDGSTVSNPLYNASLNMFSTSDYFDVTNNFSIDWKIYQDLRMVAKLGIIKKVSNSDNFKPASHTDFEKNSGDDYFRKGQYKYSTGNDFNYDASLTLSYSKIFVEKHQLYAGVDISLLQRKGSNYDFILEGYNNDRFDFLPNANLYSKNKPTGSESLTRSIGVTANFNYTYNNRYFADLSYRVDGSSQYGKNQRFAPFWSAGIGWNLHRENFIKGISAINNLRLRGSYGETGSQSFSAYQSMYTYQYDNTDRYLMWNGATLMALGNEDLKWQKTKQLNGGLEIGLMGNRISASIDLYKKNTSNLLSRMDIPLLHGFSSYAENVGAVKNVGYEAMVSGYIIRNTQNNVIWSVTAKLAYNKSTIDKLSDAIKSQNEEYKLTGQNNKLLFEGDPQGAIYSVRSKGIDPSTGKELFIDRFGELTYTWDARDRVYIGSSDPKYRGNISSMFTYKNATLNLSFGYNWGSQQYNNTLISKIENADLRSNVDRRLLTDTWQKPGDVKLFKDINEIKAKGSLNNSKYSSRFIQDEAVFQLQSVSLSYRFDQEWLRKKLKVQSINIGCNLSDLFQISAIKMERGTNYPFARRVNFSLSLMF